jgi:hypothetical protein
MKISKYILIILTLVVISSQSNLSFLNEFESNSDNWNCQIDKKTALEKFKNKKLINPFPNFKTNPYKNHTTELLNEINASLSNNTIVCAIKYKDENKILYEIENFESKQSAEEKGFIVTHQGKCGACSNLNDLAVYLSGGLTQPVRKCGLLTILSSKLALECLKDIGFTNSCAEIWLYNSINTREECFSTCIISWIKNEPFADKNGKLNTCINCDEVISGPVFKYFSGRTRRNSGIESEIKRPDEQIYRMDHCYY